MIDMVEGKQYTFEEAIDLFEKIEKPDLALDELILLTLGLLEDKPINGRVVFHKEVFLLYNELIKKGLKVATPDFKKYKLGPFSFIIASLIESLEFAGYIEISNKRSMKTSKYQLTEKGRKVANKIIENLSKRYGISYINSLRELRKGWDQLGHDGILRYVYQNYPVYHEKSIVKKDYIHIDWGGLEA